MLSLTGIRASYGSVPVLDGVDLHVAEGEIVILLGPNGAGKSTTIKVASGLLRPQAGQVLLAGTDITKFPGWRRVGAGIATVPEGRQIFPDQTVWENLALGGYTRRRAEIAKATQDLFDLFPRLGERREQLAGTLSGGEAQMLAIARALMSRPRVLLLDEPSLGLAPAKTTEVFDYITRLNYEQGLSILLVEQQVASALNMGQRGYLMHRGQIALSGSTAALSEDPRVQAVYLGSPYGS